VTTEEKQTFASNAVIGQAQYQQAQANLDQARVNLQRTEIHSLVNGSVSNLLAQPGDGTDVGQNQISLVDADSFRADGYFEQTNIGQIHVGDPAEVKLMGYSEPIRGHGDSIARAINVANAQPNGQRPTANACPKSRQPSATPRGRSPSTPPLSNQTMPSCLSCATAAASRPSQSDSTSVVCSPSRSAGSTLVGTPAVG
jgi:hypothetical protein